MLAVAMCPRSRRPCAKLQRHGQEAILRGCRRAPELGREPAGLGRSGQSRAGGEQPLPPDGSRSQLSPTDATAQHGCDSGTAPAQIYRGGACLQLRGVRQPGFGQRRAARQGLRPALPRGAMGAGRAGAAAGRAHGVTQPAPAPAPAALGDAAIPCQGKGGFAARRSSQDTAVASPSHQHRAERAPCLSFLIPRPAKALAAATPSPKQGKPYRLPATAQTPKPDPPKPLSLALPARLPWEELLSPGQPSLPPQGRAPPAAPQGKGGPPPAPPAPGRALPLHQGRGNHWSWAGVQDPTPQRAL